MRLRLIMPTKLSRLKREAEPPECAAKDKLTPPAISQEIALNQDLPK